MSAAGRKLGFPKATVSCRLVLLEHSVGTELLKRSTRSLSLTDAGQRFFERVGPIVHDAESAQSELKMVHSEPAGTLRISAPLVFGQTVIAPKLLSFLKKYPRVRADLHFSGERVNLIADGFDLVIRMGELTDSALLSQRLSDVAGALVAAPSHLEAHGYP